MNYDPNLTNSGKRAVQTVKLTFASWEYRTEMTIEVAGNCKGFTVIDAAVDAAYEKLPTRCYGNGIEAAHIILQHGEDTLECEDDDGDEVEWLKAFLVRAEIIDIQPATDN